MTDEKSINNPYLDIVDTAILGKGPETQNTIQDILSLKINDEINDYSKEISNTMFDNEYQDEDEIEEDEIEEDEIEETESDEDESEN